MPKKSEKQNSLNLIKRKKRANQILSGFIKSIKKLVIDENLCNSVDLIKGCKGKVITSGMGKAGIAMKKFTATLCSLGIPSCFVHPGEAAHGDLGILNSNDILFACSNSGRTREILELIAFSRRLNISKVIGLTSNKISPISGCVDLIIDIGKVKEEGILGLAPTTSIVIFGIVTDIVALLVSEENGLTKEQFSVFHHGGYLGEISRQ